MRIYGFKSAFESAVEDEREAWREAFNDARLSGIETMPPEEAVDTALNDLRDALLLLFLE